jgi:predicted lipoprotein with Yx(FWY)xxD motif
MSQLSRRVARGVAVVAALSIAPALAVPALAGAQQHAAARKPAGTIRVEKSSKYGSILVTASGRTLYLLTADSVGKSACMSSCSAIWPPLTSKGKPKAGKGVKRKLLGTIERGNGVRQVTYDGHPLYMYAGDTGAGQVNGEGIQSFGGTWYVLGGGGIAVTAAQTSGSGSSGSGGGGW